MSRRSLTTHRIFRLDIPSCNILSLHPPSPTRQQLMTDQRIMTKRMYIVSFTRIAFINAFMPKLEQSFRPIDQTIESSLERPSQRYIYEAVLGLQPSKPMPYNIFSYT